ncbi:hypothetical protein HD806DRAFT_10967 [Xylariaceae sp. AK1471]|nr:hypothetical protein HD806DRAFT_10967 [Xylariaceae sp. AK1471]
MEDKKSELLQYAREYATANKDLYGLLSVSADAAQPEIHRAWRKASLKHHPDKAKNFDPEIWQLFERARDVLSSAEARSAYDSARAAALQTQKARAALDAKKREMIEDLEARERGVKRKAGETNGNGGRHMMTEAEKRVLMEKGREHLEKRRKLKEEAEARERERQRTRMEDEAASASAEREREEAERQQSSQQPDFDRIPIPTDNGRTAEDIDMYPPPPTDEYDERIADLERRLRERKAEKAARKAQKKNNNQKDHKNEGVLPLASEDRKSPPIPAASLPQSVSTQLPTTTTTSSKPAPPGDFSSTMAKLRAAQREKERKKAEAAAAAEC